LPDQFFAELLQKPFYCVLFLSKILDITTTRSAAEVWLVGKPTEKLSTARLPSKDVLRRLLFHHLEENQEVKMSVRATAVLEVWERARIPMHRTDAAERKIRKLYVGRLLTSSSYIIYKSE